MSLLDSLFSQVAGAITHHSNDNTPGPGYDANPILGALQGMFSNHAQQSGQQYNRNANYDNGESYNQQYGNVLPASQDPYGDPADQERGGYAGQNVNQNANDGRFGNVLPASADPYGDPADQ